MQNIPNPASKVKTVVQKRIAGETPALPGSWESRWRDSDDLKHAG